MLCVCAGSVLAGLLALLALQRAAWPFFWGDLRHYLRLRGLQRTVRGRMRRGVRTLLDCFLLQARRSPHKAFLICGERSLTYRDVDRRSRQFAAALGARARLQPGHVVALLMSNEPDFVCAWLGLSRLGCQVAFLNTNLRAGALLHCVRACAARVLLLGADLVEPVVEALPGLRGAGTGLWVVAHSAPTEDFHTLLDKLEDPPGDTPVPEVDVMSNFLFIFTSGTTGLSKAARVGHLKALGSMAFLDLCGATREDVVYITLPLYHMSASLLGVGGCIHLGATCVLRRRFSARHFWKDCVRHNVTVVQYIGELCRYLLHQPPVLEERAHCVRLAAGSGLRSDVWRKFITRFGIRQVREGYGLTETSIGFLNYTDEVGPIGRASYFNKLSIPFKLLKFDPDTNEPVRTDSGRCIQAPAGEAGLLVAPLTAGNQFLGYAGNSEQSEKKLLRNLFEDGDVYFNTGDLLLRDHRDFLYFRDRLGDTFRWKGENVSTTEVSEALCLLDFIQEATVYGVSVPGNEGRAGMAALVLRAGLGLEGKSLYEHLVKTLPAYAWPRFIRIQTALDVTETFKQRKGKLVQEGFDPQASQDPLYVLDVSQRDYRLLTTSLFQDITSGKISL